MTAYLVLGCGYGDEGKGATVDALVRKTGADLIIRYNGGAQCAHNVITPEGRHHAFSQFGSGSFVPGIMTYLSKFVLVDPVRMLAEVSDLASVGVNDGMERMFIDCRAVVVTRFQKALNRLQEISRNKNSHGSTGMGIGVTRSDHLEYGDAMLLVKDLEDSKTTRDKLIFIRQLCKSRADALVLDRHDTETNKELYILTNDSIIPKYLEAYRHWNEMAAIAEGPPMVQHRDVVFEGAQGILLDERWGFQPHTTWTDITFTNAETILKEMDYKEEIYKLGVLRSYHTRHGNGPFPSEDLTLNDNPCFKEPHNTGMKYTGNFRIGHFDEVLAQYALDIVGVDGLAINHLDTIALNKSAKVRTSNGYLTLPYCDFLPTIEELLGIPIAITGFGATYYDKIFKAAALLRRKSCLACS